MSLSPYFTRITGLLLLLSGPAAPALAATATWEYQVVIIQGVTAGGKIEKQSSGVFVDTKKTRILNELASDGWEVVSAIGGSATDHVLYLRRKR